ncbi:MAG: hypothetical protein PUG43_05605 [Clostridiales bacterium]|nr:hypothetical protein [Clostridiales bacterium]MDD7347976.1 hypothetical protein [Clostridiales bacterium]MDY4060792.1 hypothetical protein [Anaerovoracaceae bacterium]
MLGQILTMVMGVILFAIAAAILYMIGMKKKMNQDERLVEMLLNNGAYRVVKYLRSHGEITLKGIGYVIKDISAKEFGSSKKAIIQDGRAFQDRLLEYMIKNGYIVEGEGNDRRKKSDKVYKLPEK